MGDDKGKEKDAGKSLPQGLTIDRAAFLLLRVKRVFRKKKQQRKQKSELPEIRPVAPPGSKQPPPLLRSRTLPAIVVPGLSILQAQIGPKYHRDLAPGPDQELNTPGMARLSIADTNLLDPRRHLAHHRLSSPDPSTDSLRSGSVSTSSSPRFLMGSNSAFYRFTRRLNKPEPDASRRHSWETEEGEVNGSVTRSASIDSIDSHVGVGKNCVSLVRSRLPSPLHRTPATSPGAASLQPSDRDRDREKDKKKKDKTHRGSSCPPLVSEIGDYLNTMTYPTASGAYTESMALFAAVEHGHLEKARTILETNTVNLNQVNSDGFSLLDVAYLGRNEALVRLLIAFGAQEGNKYCDGDGMGSHLRDLMSEAEVKLDELRGSLEQDEAAASALCTSASTSTSKSSATTAAATAAAAAVAEATKNYSLWERRLRGLRKMISGFDQTRVPDPPSVVEAEVTQSTSVTVRFKEPDHQDTPVTTKFKVEWSKDSNFRNLTGSLDVLDAKQAAVNVENLTHGDRYFFRVACGNLKGFSPFKNSMPASVIPSSWRDISQKEERLGTDKIELLEDLFNEIRIYRPDIEDFKDPSVSDSQAGQRKKKTTIKQLFTATSKFQKHLRRGVFLSSLFYHEDKVLVTNEEFLPVIEVDETYPGALNHDFHWFLKVSCTWEDIKWMKNDMEKSLNSSSVHFRVKLLTAAMQMQAALGVQDLGQLYHRILKDTDGTTIICTINYCRNPKNISVLNSKWLPLGKIMKRTCMIDPAGANVSELLMFSIQEQITYHQVSSMKLQRGLYLGYLKMRSSVDLLYVIVPTKTPNVPPHCKIRANPHVTAEEWDWLVNGQGDASNGTEQQKLFADQIAAAAERLFTYMQVLPEHINQHRFYDIEVVEMSADVSLLMVIPPIEVACAPPGQKDFPFPRNDMIALPVPVFETAYLQAYQKLFISRYSRLSCIFELNTALAQHSHREAFSNSEVAIAKERLTRLEALQSNLSDCWKSVRWLMDMLNFARDRNSPTPTVMKQLLATHPRNPSATTESPLPRQLLEPPVPGPSGVRTRGSWPGPGIAKLLGTATAELSRSEQQLSYASCSTTSIVNPPTVIPTRPPPPIPIINPIMVPSCSTSRLPPSKSEDTLAHHASCSRLATPPLLHNTPGGSMLNVSGSLRSLSSDESVSAVRSKSEGEEDGVTMPTPSPGILQVYAAYETGLAAGTSLKLHVSPRTTAREVVDLVVKQLNMAVVFKGKGGPIYPNDQLSNFCLVAVIGARERCLRDDFKLLQLQNPWKKGRLYVRQKQDVLAALEHSSRYIVPLK
ncbi:ankyrin repeat and fibronectin type-III domain-containing protein 1 isoform X2 [Bemisia tabaci]|uniref:ankyrin repeat and fibronectin type-III domain-containing protein 1 isoform X2 n=1 Tax=Bemisia tabaci TaxID=7038 RepID=UPI003B286664